MYGTLAPAASPKRAALVIPSVDAVRLAGRVRPGTGVFLKRYGASLTPLDVQARCHPITSWDRGS